MNADSGLMAGKKGLIMGVANERSIAWHIANATSKQGAELAFTYQGDALLKRVTPLATSIGSDIILQCDVTNEPSIDNVFSEIRKRWGRLDFIVHAIAYSDRRNSLENTLIPLQKIFPKLCRSHVIPSRQFAGGGNLLCRKVAA